MINKATTTSQDLYRKSKMQIPWRFLPGKPMRQAETIARHYLEQATIAKHVMEFLWCVKMAGANSDSDYAILKLISTIKENHALDFGIELDWPTQEHDFPTGRVT